MTLCHGLLQDGALESTSDSIMITPTCQDIFSFSLTSSSGLVSQKMVSENRFETADQLIGLEETRQP